MPDKYSISTYGRSSFKQWGSPLDWVRFYRTDIMCRILDLTTLQLHPKLGSCWVYGGPTNEHGYGRIYINRVSYYVHRIAWMLTYDEDVPDETLDHRCRNHPCWNVAHTEPTTRGINTARGGNSLKTHCPNGHKYDLNIDSNRKHRGCSTCRKEATKRFCELNPDYHREWRAKRASR